MVGGRDARRLPRPDQLDLPPASRRIRAEGGAGSRARQRGRPLRPCAAQARARSPTQYAAQVHAHPNWGVTYLFLNTRVPPFNDVRVRQAANYARRSAAVPAAAQVLGAEPTCQILPPNFPGFRRYCPYTIQSRPERRLEGARSRASATTDRCLGHEGRAGHDLDSGQSDERRARSPPHSCAASATARASSTSASPLYYSDKGLGNPRSRVQAGVSSWFADYPGASSFIEFFSCKGFAHFCDPRIEALHPARTDATDH